MSDELSNPPGESNTRPLSNILAFHKLSPHLSFGSTNYSPTRFQKLFDRLLTGGYEPSTIENVIARPGERTVAVCFDDGYAHLVDTLLPLLDRFHFVPTVFVPTGYIGKTNTWDYSHAFRKEKHLRAEDIRLLAGKGVSFGSHGHSHVDLTSLSMRQLKAELTESKAILEDILGTGVSTISYPFGRCSDAILDIAAEVGYQCGFTMAYPEYGDEPLARGRYPVYFYDSWRSVLRKLQQGRGKHGGFEQLRDRLTNGLSGGTILLNRLRRFPG